MVLKPPGQPGGFLLPVGKIGFRLGRMPLQGPVDGLFQVIISPEEFVADHEGGGAEDVAGDGFLGLGLEPGLDVVRARPGEGRFRIGAGLDQDRFQNGLAADVEAI